MMKMIKKYDEIANTFDKFYSNRQKTAIITSAIYDDSDITTLPEELQDIYKLLLNSSKISVQSITDDKVPFGCHFLKLYAKFNQFPYYYVYFNSTYTINDGKLLFKLDCFTPIDSRRLDIMPPVIGNEIYLSFTHPIMEKIYSNYTALLDLMHACEAWTRL